MTEEKTDRIIAAENFIKEGEKQPREMDRYGSAKEKLIESHVTLVLNFAKRYRDKGVNFAGLVDLGNGGLSKAVETFEGKTGEEFHDHAVSFIRKAIESVVVDK